MYVFMHAHMHSPDTEVLGQPVGVIPGLWVPGLLRRYSGSAASSFTHCTISPSQLCFTHHG